MATETTIRFSKPRFRTVFLWAMFIFPAVVWILTDPQGNIIGNVGIFAPLVSLFTTLSPALWLVGFLHVAYKALFDYVEADRKALLKKALETPEGAGMALIGLGLAMTAIATVIAAVA